MAYDKAKTFFGEHWKAVLALVVVLVFVAVIWYTYSKGKSNGSGNPVIVDDSGNPVTISEADKTKAAEISKRIHDDLNSGFLFGYNVWGNIGRDSDAYWALAQMSDTMFGVCYQRYKTDYGTSLIADIRAEGSLPTDTYVRAILDKATRLNLS